MLAILQPYIPHYREEFFDTISDKINSDVFCYDNESSRNHNYSISKIKVKQLRNSQKGPLLFYNPFPLLDRKYSTLVLMLNFGHITTWLLLLTKPFHRKKIIVWGQGISVKRYLKEEKKPSILLKWMISLANGVWIYTAKEKMQWQKIFPNKPITALNNTLSGIERIVSLKHPLNQKSLKDKYGITQPTCFIFCARFNNSYRRIDLLMTIIKQLENKKHAFIIIGDGPVKPDFTPFSNVYDFGQVYDNDLKDDLFSIADLYIQPGWVGLSVVEALAYGKPVVTFQRSKDVLQCVEYSYLENNFNALIFDSVSAAVNRINNLTKDQMHELSRNAKKYASKNLSMKQMTNNALEIL